MQYCSQFPGKKKKKKARLYSITALTIFVGPKFPACKLFVVEMLCSVRGAFRLHFFGNTDHTLVTCSGAVVVVAKSWTSNSKPNKKATAKKITWNPKYIRKLVQVQTYPSQSNTETITRLQTWRRQSKAQSERKQGSQPEPTDQTEKTQKVKIGQHGGPA